MLLEAPNPASKALGNVFVLFTVFQNLISGILLFLLMTGACGHIFEANARMSGITMRLHKLLQTVEWRGGVYVFVVKTDVEIQFVFDDV